MITKEVLKGAWTTYVKSYAIWFKIGLLITLFVAGWVTSTKYHENADAQVDAEVAAEIATLRQANYEYEQADLARARVAASQQAAQKQREEQAQKEVTAAQERAETLAERLAEIERKQREAAKDPKCRDIMELEVCPALR